MSEFRRLLDICDKQAKEELDNYYIIKESNMNNMIDCLDQGAEKIKQLEEEVERLQKKLEPDNPPLTDEDKIRFFDALHKAGKVNSNISVEVFDDGSGIVMNNHHYEDLEDFNFNSIKEAIEHLETYNEK